MPDSLLGLMIGFSCFAYITFKFLIDIGLSCTSIIVRACDGHSRFTPLPAALKCLNVYLPLKCRAIIPFARVTLSSWFVVCTWAWNPFSFYTFRLMKSYYQFYKLIFYHHSWRQRWLSANSSDKELIIMHYLVRKQQDMPLHENLIKPVCMCVYVERGSILTVYMWLMISRKVLYVPNKIIDRHT